MKLIKTGFDAKESIRKGVDTVANVVKVTLGPTAHSVVLSRKFGSPIVSDDGVTVAREVEVEDPFEQIGVALIQEIATKTNETAGDGTTTATVIAQSIINKAFEVISFNSSKCAEIKAGMDKAVAEVVRRLKELKRDITTPEEIEQIATISSLDSELGKLISNMMQEVGKNGVITVEEGNGTTYSTEVVKGMQFDRGYVSPYFANPATQIAEIDNAYILILSGKLNSLREVMPLLEKFTTVSKNLLIIADEVEGEVLNTLVINKLRGMLNVVAVRSPGHGDNRQQLLEDICALTGASFIDEVGLKLIDAKVEHLGRANKVKVTRDNTTIVDGLGFALQERIEKLKSEIPISEYDKEQLNKRIAGLSGGVGVIKVGAPTEIEVKARKFKLEDALNATRAAIEEGVIPGGGSTLARLSPEITTFANTLPEFEKLGATFIAESLTSPLLQLAENTGTNGTEILKKVQESEDGYDFKKHTYGDLFLTGVIDPVKVTRLALENAASIASILITSEAVIVDKPEEKESSNGNS